MLFRSAEGRGAGKTAPAALAPRSIASSPRTRGLRSGRRGSARALAQSVHGTRGRSGSGRRSRRPPRCVRWLLAGDAAARPRPSAAVNLDYQGTKHRRSCRLVACHFPGLVSCSNMYSPYRSWASRKSCTPNPSAFANRRPIHPCSFPSHHLLTQTRWPAYRPGPTDKQPFLGLSSRPRPAPRRNRQHLR